MKKHQDERTLVIIKPDGVQRSLVGEIIKRFERAGLKLVAMKMKLPKSEEIEKHYAGDGTWFEKTGKKTIQAYLDKGQTPPSDDPIFLAKRVLGRLTSYLTTSPSVFMIWQGAHAVSIVRKLVGSTEPLSSDVGTIRGDFVIDSYEASDVQGRSIRNVIHASGNTDEASSEIDLWFDKSEIINYRLVQEQILYDVNLDGLLE